MLRKLIINRSIISLNNLHLNYKVLHAILCKKRKGVPFWRRLKSALFFVLSVVHGFLPKPLFQQGDGLCHLPDPGRHFG